MRSIFTMENTSRMRPRGAVNGRPAGTDGYVYVDYNRVLALLENPRAKNVAKGKARLGMLFLAQGFYLLPLHLQLMFQMVIGIGAFIMVSGLHKKLITTTFHLIFDMMF